jgi:hypothetical protein
MPAHVNTYRGEMMRNGGEDCSQEKKCLEARSSMYACWVALVHTQSSGGSAKSAKM